MRDLHTRPKPNTQARDGLIHAEISGDDIAAALGVTARSTSPVLALCRLLVEKGIDPATPLEAWRGSVLALRVRSIGEATRLEVTAKGTGFIRSRALRTAPPIAKTARPGVGQRAGSGRAHGAPSRRAAS
jgi:hypothetical protein